MIAGESLRLARGKSEHHTAARRVKDAGAAAPKAFGVAVTESVTEKTPPVLWQCREALSFPRLGAGKVEKAR